MRISYSYLIGDLIHIGHVKMFEIASRNADRHICGLLSDRVVDQWIDPKLCDFAERKAVLEKMRHIDEVMQQDSIDPTENLRAIRTRYPDATIVLIKNHILGKSSYGVEYVESIGGETVEYEYYPKLSRENIAEAFYRSLNKRGGTHSSESGRRPAPMLFGTKANTLQKLKDLLRHAVIEEEVVFTQGEWERDREEIIGTVRTRFGQEPVVVRSSSLSEDLHHFSNAGHFESILNVRPDGDGLAEAVEQVLESYRRGKTPTEHDQVLVQRQTKDVAISGVIFTRNLRVNTPYYLINYDDSTGRTDSVTGGDGGKKLEILRTVEPETLPSPWKELLRSVREIEDIFQSVALDIEFAVRRDGSIVIFQVRPLAANSRFHNFNDQSVIRRVDECVRQFERLSDAYPYTAVGPCFSDMAFWNPAELIGDRPKYLDASLFNHLIMKELWSSALTPLGYTAVNDHLMEMVAGKPYINLHHSFRALTPASVPEPLAAKLLRFYRDRIVSDHTLHDKIEFEIVHNCYRFDLESGLSELRGYGLAEPEIETLRRSLFTLTDDVLTRFDEITADDERSIRELDRYAEQARSASSARPSVNARLTAIAELIERCRMLGIPAFVRAARFAFIGNALLKSLVRTGAVSSETLHGFLSTIPTVATEMDADFDRLKQGRLTSDRFLSKYWHLRPGTYDITKLPYGKNPSYFTMTSAPAGPAPASTGPDHSAAASELTAELGRRLKQHGFSVTGELAVRFITESTQRREFYKFVYTKAISLAIELAADIGAEAGLSREDMAYVDFYSLVNHRDTCSATEVFGLWTALIEQRKGEYALNTGLSLPPLLFGTRDLTVIHTTTARPNYITDNAVSGDVVVLDNADASTQIDDRIVAIEKADPGYDWIFTHRIKGLITKYGGAASHMAIRCAEFDLPAAIGCGEIIFTKVASADRILLDCKNKTINIV